MLNFFVEGLCNEESLYWLHTIVYVIALVAVTYFIVANIVHNKNVMSLTEKLVSFFKFLLKSLDEATTSPLNQKESKETKFSVYFSYFLFKFLAWISILTLILFSIWGIQIIQTESEPILRLKVMSMVGTFDMTLAILGLILKCKGEKILYAYQQLEKCAHPPEDSLNP